MRDPYEPPALTRLGTMTELTQAVLGGQSTDFLSQAPLVGPLFGDDPTS